LNRFVFPAILAVLLAARGAAADLGQLDASPTLFTVMAALNAAGYGVDAASPNNDPLRRAVQEELAKKKIPSLEPLKAFFERHRQRNDAVEFSQYVSFALTAGSPPDFPIKLRDVEIPPDVSPLQELSPLLAAFYQEADIDDLWRRSQAGIDRQIARYHHPVSEAVLQINSYLRQQTSGFRGRHFQIFIEPLGPPNQVQTRSYGHVYTIVVTPSAEPRIFDIRHAYLHYLLDPLSTRNQEVLERKKPLAEQAKRARLLDESFKEDFLLLTTESLIKAVEARLDRNPKAIQQALEEGYILAPYFAEQLPAYEKQEQAMMLYFAEMAKAIDVTHEDARLAQVQFLRERPERVVKVEVPAPPLAGVDKTLEDAEQLYTSRELDRAKKLYLEALRQTDRKPQHAGAYYGLARIAVLQKDPETAERLFQTVLGLEPEPPTRAWTLVYLGRLSLAAGNREQAVENFQSALKVQGASPAAQEAASKGLEQTTRP
jgi:tetratricopeptide (TPR) repeat protein